MKLITDYITSFLQRSGGYVLTATIISRFCSFLASWLAIQFIPNKELGVVLFAYNIVILFIPFSGLGLHQSLIRYGALLNSNEEKNNLFVYVFKNGLITSIIIVFILILIALNVTFKFNNTGAYLAALSLLLIPNFILSIIKIQFRLQHKNKQFSYVDILLNTLLVVLVLVLSYLYQEKGYIIALILAPLITAIVFFNKLNIRYSVGKKPKITNFKFWKYGIYSGLTSVVSDLLFVIDILLIGYLLNNSELVTAYKYVSIIPISILFLPRVFMATDFVTITEKINNKKYIFKYVKSYMTLFVVVSIIYSLVSYIFSKEILALIDVDLVKHANSFFILSIGTCGILIFRGLFGNLLSSIGKMHINYYIVSVAILINIIANYYLIPTYGVKGAAITSASLMWLTGIASYIWFKNLYKKLLSKNGFQKR